MDKVEVIFTPDALRQFRKAPRAERSFLRQAIKEQLINSDPAETTRNRFRLKRVSEFADSERRAGSWRIFYRLEPDTVIVTLIGQKRGNVLVTEGEEFQL
ncbi:MAG: type II toxin-antitoxin system RelE family toxin [Gammaproteobacteria bacterium]